MDALQAVAAQTSVTWYPWGQTVVVLPKEQQVRQQLGHTINARYADVDVAQVLLELSRRAGVPFDVEPGAYQRVPAAYRKVSLLLDDATVQSALESIGGYHRAGVRRDRRRGSRLQPVHAGPAGDQSRGEVNRSTGLPGPPASAGRGTDAPPPAR